MVRLHHLVVERRWKQIIGYSRNSHKILANFFFEHKSESHGTYFDGLVKTL